MSNVREEGRHVVAHGHVGHNLLEDGALAGVLGVLAVIEQFGAELLDLACIGRIILAAFR